PLITIRGQPQEHEPRPHVDAVRLTIDADIGEPIFPTLPLLTSRNFVSFFPLLSAAEDPFQNAHYLMLCAMAGVVRPGTSWPQENEARRLRNKFPLCHVLASTIPRSILTESTFRSLKRP